MEFIFICIHSYVTYDVKNTFSHIPVLLNNARQKFIRTNLIKFQYYSFILDTIDTNLYKTYQAKQNKN